MAYSAAWDETAPVGSTTQSSDIDLLFRNFKRDLRERMTDVVNDFTTDPILGVVSCKAKKTASQSIPNAATTVVTFDGEFWDTDGLHDNAVNNSRITVPANAARGVWVLTFSALWDPALVTGNRRLFIRKNGLAIVGIANLPASAAVSAYLGHQLVAIARGVVAGDYFEAEVYQNQGAAVNLLGENVGVDEGSTFAAYQIL